MIGSIFTEKTVFGAIPPERLAAEPGLNLMREMIEGKLPPPPIARLMNFQLSAASEGYAEFRGVPLEDHYNPAGVVHGGWAATILDSALGCCAWTLVPVGTAYTTAEFKVNLVRPLTRDTGEVVCEARVIHFGRTLATTEGTLKTVDGKLLAHGTETCAMFKMR